MNEKLNHLLSDFVVEYHKLQSMHWYVKGPEFFQVHAKLEELYDGVNAAIDGVAELILQNGGQPVSSLASMLGIASIAERADDYIDAAEVFDVVLADFKALLDEVVSIKRAADAEDAYLVSASMDGYIAEFSKLIWMIEQSKR